jgi:hypothetical protein
MSKILIDEDTLYSVIDALNIGYLISSKKEQQRIFAMRNELLDELQETKKHFSVLEWHPMSEAPSSNAGCVLVEYSGGGFGFAFGHTETLKDDPDYKRWSYLPE